MCSTPITTPENRSRASQAQWYAVHTKSRHEKFVADRLQERAVPVFLPMMPEIHRWSDRRKKVYVPLFSCYVFVNILPEAHQAVLQNPGVLGFVSFAGRPAEIPEEQMEVVRKVCKHDIPCSSGISAGRPAKLTNPNTPGFCSTAW